MGPHTLQAWQNATKLMREDLAAGQHVLVGDETVSVLRTIAGGPDDSDFYWEFALPNPITVFERPDGAVIFKDRSEFVDMTLLAFPQGKIRFHRNSNKCQMSPILHDLYESGDAWVLSVLEAAHICDLLFSLMAEPRLLKKSPVARQRRRASERITGVAMPGAVWTDVCWTVGGEVAAKNGCGDGNIRMPLHHCRAHWRHAKKGQPKAVKRQGHSGWWIKVKHSWKGHPDFGIRLHRLKPEIDLEGASADVVAAVATAAMQQAAAAAIAQWQTQ